MYKRCSKGRTIGGGRKGRKKRGGALVQQCCVPTSDITHYSSTLNKLEGQTVIWLPFTQRDVQSRWLDKSAMEQEPGRVSEGDK